jgi:anti-sigma B factor antagonist
MEVDFKEVQGITLASLKGKLDSASSNQVQDELLHVITPKAKVILDFNQCSFVSSAGLRTLLILAKRAKSQVANVVMAGASEEILDVMEMTGFDDMFETFLSVDDALGSMKGSLDD